MAFLGQTYNAEDLPQSQGNFDPIPDGWYSAAVESCELKDTSKGGKMLSFCYNVTGPNFAGRKVWDNINIINKNPKAEEIGRSQMGDIMRAAGLGNVQDTDQFIGANIQIKVRTEKSEGYDPRNVVKGWKALEGGAPAIGGGSSSPSAVSGGSSAPSGNKPPWAKD